MWSEIWEWVLKNPAVLAALITFILGVGWQLATRVFAAKPRIRWGLTSDTVFLVPRHPQSGSPVSVPVPAGAAAAPAQQATPPPASTHPPVAASVLPAVIQTLPPPTDAYRARNIWLFNSGKAVAEDVELAFNWQPQHMEWYPHLPTSVKFQPDARYILTISRLNPKEGVNFSLLSLNQIHPDLMHVRCKGFSGKRIELRSQPVASLWITVPLAMLVLFGIYTLVKFVIYLFMYSIY